MDIVLGAVLLFAKQLVKDIRKEQSIEHTARSINDSFRKTFDCFVLANM